MSPINRLNTFWPDWNVEEKVGSGSFGEVYRVSRKIGDKTFFSAVKIISIPQNQAEVDAMRAEINDEKSTRQYFQEIVNDCISEISLMMDLRGASNIVNVEDYKVYEYPNEIRWDIYIRMEYLTCLTALMSQRSFSEPEVCKLGSDLCNALGYCEKHHIIHRDIKPGNIFISDDGDYKLGDFGVARKASQTLNTMSTKGTYDYMAPEMFSPNYYDATVDTYALGIVLYKLLNRNRGPFLDANAEHIHPGEKDRALAARLSGRELPPPANASQSMYAVIKKACSFKAENRYSSPAMMKSDLEDILSGKTVDQLLADTYQVPLNQNAPIQPDTFRMPPTQSAQFQPDAFRMPPNQNAPFRTDTYLLSQDQSSPFPGDAYPPPEGQGNYQPVQNPYRNYNAEQKKPSRVPMIPFVIIGCIAMIVVGFFAGSKFDKIIEDGPKSAGVDSIISETATEYSTSVPAANGGTSASP
ncbi:MAG TPA: hypothetical protein DCX23_04925, partial [Lachnospiraceae bacterium]|nr:hypothetical protein [Lachnospiraceae bacterium]